MSRPPASTGLGAAALLTASVWDESTVSVTVSVVGVGTWVQVTAPVLMICRPSVSGMFTVMAKVSVTGALGGRELIVQVNTGRPVSSRLLPPAMEPGT